MLRILTVLKKEYLLNERSYRWRNLQLPVYSYAAYYLELLPTGGWRTE